jgi:CubicO group peptidase (beta-lactamase class C family)
MRSILRLSIAACFLTIDSLSAQSVSDLLTTKLTALQGRSAFPGFGVAIVSKDSVLYQHGFGLADLADGTPYTVQTVQPIGSVSKTLIGVSLMQCIERGLFSLDTPINDLLPFRVVNPYFPTDTIRVRHLATHTSGLLDYEPTYQKTYVFAGERGTVPAATLKGYDLSGKNAGTSLRDFLAGYYGEGGRFYDRRNFGKSRPGQTYAYSNIGAALAAYLIEAKTGLSYADYTYKNILNPLGMSSSRWRSDSLTAPPQAKSYSTNRQTYPTYESITYPDGNLRTSCADLGLYLRAILKSYAGQPGLLSPASGRTLFAPQFGIGKMPKNLPEREPNSGIFWVIRNNGSIGHTGSDPGVTAFLFFNPKTGIGKLFMTNTDMEESPELLRQFVDIWKLLGDTELALTH